MQDEFEKYIKIDEMKDDKSINAFANYSYKQNDEEGIKKYLLSDEEIKLRELEEKQIEEERLRAAQIDKKLNEVKLNSKQVNPVVNFKLKSEEKQERLKSRIKYYFGLYAIVFMVLVITAITTAISLEAVNADIEANQRAIDMIERSI